MLHQDVFDETFEDQTFTVDGSTTALQLNKPLEDSVVYNVYRNGVRIDDPNYPSDGSTPILNSNAIMTSITGDGQQQVIDLNKTQVSEDIAVNQKYGD